MLSTLLGFLIFLVIGLALMIMSSMFFTVGIPLIKIFKSDSLPKSLTRHTTFDKVVVILGVVWTVIVSLSGMSLLAVFAYALIWG